MVQKKVVAAVFLIGAALGMRFAPFAGSWTAGDLAAPVLALGVALPAGWLGMNAIKRR